MTRNRTGVMNAAELMVRRGGAGRFAASAVGTLLAAGLAVAAPQQTTVAPTPIGVYGTEEFWGGAVNPLNTEFTFTLNAGYQVARMRFKAQVRVENVPDNFAADLGALVTPPGRDAVFVKLLPDTTQAPGSVLQTDILRVLPGGPYPSGGTWTVKLIDVFAQDVTGQTLEQTVSGLEITAEDPTFAEPTGTVNLGAITQSTQVSGTMGAFQVKWYKFSTERVDSADNQYLDIVTAASSSDNLMLLVCDDEGFPIDYDTFKGVGSRGLLSFGVGGGAANSGIGTAVGTSDPYAGTYYVGVCRQPAMDNTYNPINNELNPFNLFPFVDGPASSFTLNFVKGVSTVQTPTVQETFTLAQPTVTRSVNLSANEVKWYVIDTTGTDVSAENGRFVDINVTSPDIEFPSISLYDAQGRLVKFGQGTTLAGAANETLSMGMGSGAALGTFFEVNLIGGGSERALGSTGFSGPLAGGVYYLAVGNSFQGQPREGFRVYADPEEPSSGGQIDLKISSGTRLATAPAATNLGTINGTVSTSSTLGSAQTRWYRFDVPTNITGFNGRYLDLRTTGATRNTYLAVFDAAGNVIASDDNDGFEANAWISFGVGESNALGDDGRVGGRDGNIDAGTYYVALMPGASNQGLGFSTAAFDDGESDSTTLVISRGARSASAVVGAEDLGTANSNVISTSVAVASDAVKWMRFTLSNNVTQANGRYFELVLSTLDSQPGAHAAVAIYDSAGGLRAIVNPLSEISSRRTFGAGPSFTVATGEPLWFDERVDLPAGEYFMGIAPRNFGFAPLFEVVPVDFDTGGVVSILISEGVRQAIAQPTSTVDLGTLTGGARSVSSVLSDRLVSWYRFTADREISPASGYWLDIDAAGSSADGLGRNVEALAIYTSDGRLIARQAFNSFTFKPGLSFGAKSPLRRMDGTPNERDVAMGQDGVLPAGEYVIGIAQLGIFFEDGFQSRQRVSIDEGGRLTLNVRSNLPSASCNPADIACDDGVPLGVNPGCVNSSSGPNEGDYNAFFSAEGFFFQASQGSLAVGSFCDVACDDGTPKNEAPSCINNGVNEGDYNAFFNALFLPCV